MPDITHDMLQDDSITCFPAQVDNPEGFADVVGTWASSKWTKEKYLKHDWQQQKFTTTEVNEIFHALKEDVNDADIPHDKNDFMSSNLFKTMLEQVNMLEHNFNEGGGKDIVFFERQDIKEVIKMAGLMYQHEEGDKKGAIQFNCDFTHIPKTDWVLGICGIDDFAHRQWPTTFIICHTENAGTALKVMKRMVDLINADLNGSTDKALIDGAGALKAACKELNLSPRSCFAHIMRLPLTRGGGKVGSKGSLANYLISTMGVKHADAAKVSHFILSLLVL